MYKYLLVSNVDSSIVESHKSNQVFDISLLNNIEQSIDKQERCCYTVVVQLKGSTINRIQLN